MDEKKDFNTFQDCLLQNLPCDSFCNKDLILYSLELLETELKNFQPYYDVSYLLRTIPFLYEVFRFHFPFQKDVNARLQHIRLQIKKLLEHDALYLRKANHKSLKKLLGKIELLSFQIRDSFDENFSEYKFELIYYMIFSIKNLDVLKSILKRVPHQINILDSKSFSLVETLIQTYLDTLQKHVQDETYSHLEDLLYYDRVLFLLLEHNNPFFTPSILKKLDSLFSNALLKTPESYILKERYVYFILKWREFFQTLLQEKEVSFSISKEELSYQYLIEKEFSLGCLSNAKLITIQTHMPSYSKDMPKIYTVDGCGAKELDDGFSCDKNGDIYRLGIHITNPFAYMEKDSLLFSNAFKRTSSVYLKKSMLPMFPEPLSCDLFSLKEGTVRHALSLYFEIDLKQGCLNKIEPIFEPVYVSRNDTYVSCSKTIKQQHGNPQYLQTLNNIQELLPFLKKFYNMDEMYKKVNRVFSNASSTNITGSSSSDKMIEGLMIFTNHMFAKYVLEKKIPFLFRNHQITKFYQEDLNTYCQMISREKQNESYMVEARYLLSNYPKSFYDSENIGHYGLGLDSYTHITSPDRRVADCFNLWMFQEYLKGTNFTEETVHDLKRVALHINERENTLNNFVKEYSLIKKKK